MKQILLVEDDDTIRAIFAQVLVEEGYAVTQASDGQHALELAVGSFRPDLLITDNSMRTMSGQELTERLWEAQAGLPVLWITGRPPDEDTVDRLAARGTLRWLLKPIMPDRLCDTVVEMIGHP